MDPQRTGIACNYQIIPPVSLHHKNALLCLLKDPASSWAEVEATIDAMAKEQEILLNNKIKQIRIAMNLDKYLNSVIYKGKMGLHHSGLNPDTGLSYYQPETYARIVSIKKTRDDLLNTDNNFTYDVLENIKKIMVGHLNAIQADNITLIKLEQRDYFSLRKASYIPEKNPDTSPMDHRQWASKMDIESAQFKMRAIISGLREIHSVNLQNITELQRRGPLIAALNAKAAPLKEHTQKLQTSMKKLKEGFMNGKHDLFNSEHSES